MSTAPGERPSSWINCNDTTQSASCAFLPAVARQQVVLPPGVQPSLAPLSTAIGEIFRYVLEGLGMDESEVRALQDWVLRPASLTSSALTARSRNIKCRSIRSP